MGHSRTKRTSWSHSRIKKLSTSGNRMPHVSWLSQVQSLLQVVCAEPAAVQCAGSPAFKCPSFSMPTMGQPKKKIPTIGVLVQVAILWRATRMLVYAWTEGELRRKKLCGDQVQKSHPQFLLHSRIRQL